MGTKAVINDLLNNWILWPVIFSVANGYFLPTAFFGYNAIDKATELFVGMGFLHIMVICFVLGANLVTERIQSKVLQYHIGVTSFSTAFFARLFFNIMYAYLLFAPFYLVAKLMLGQRLITTTLSWTALLGVLFLVITMCTSYIFVWLAVINDMQSFDHIWERGIETILWLGGMWAPGYAIAKGMPGGSYIATYNPFVYVTDGLRQLFIPGPQYAPLGTCCLVMIGATVIFTIISYSLLRWRMDAV